MFMKPHTLSLILCSVDDEANEELLGNMDVECKM